MNDDDDLQITPSNIAEMDKVEAMSGSEKKHAGMKRTALAEPDDDDDDVESQMRTDAVDRAMENDEDRINDGEGFAPPPPAEATEEKKTKGKKENKRQRATRALIAVDELKIGDEVVITTTNPTPVVTVKMLRFPSDPAKRNTPTDFVDGFDVTRSDKMTVPAVNGFFKTPGTATHWEHACDAMTVDGQARTVFFIGKMAFLWFQKKPESADSCFANVQAVLLECKGKLNAWDKASKKGPVSLSAKEEKILKNYAKLITDLVSSNKASHFAKGIAAQGVDIALPVENYVALVPKFKELLPIAERILKGNFAAPITAAPVAAEKKTAAKSAAAPVAPVAASSRNPVVEAFRARVRTGLERLFADARNGDRDSANAGKTSMAFETVVKPALAMAVDVASPDEFATHVNDAGDMADFVTKTWPMVPREAIAAMAYMLAPAACETAAYAAAAASKPKPKPKPQFNNVKPAAPKPQNGHSMEDDAAASNL